MPRKNGQIIKRRLPNVFSRDELLRYFDNIEDSTLAIASLLGFCCGLRIGEIVRLRWDNVNLESGKIKVVMGKSGDGYVDIPDKLISILRKWQYVINYQEYVVPYTARNMHSRTSLLTEEFHRALKKANLMIPYETRSDGKVVNKLTFHGLRHTYATFLWEETGDIYLVKDALRHAKIETTEIYAHISNPHKRKKINSAFSPQEQKIDPLNQKLELPQQTIEPKQILQLRLAKGEITLESYKQLINELTPKQTYIG